MMGGRIDDDPAKSLPMLCQFFQIVAHEIKDEYAKLHKYRPKSGLFAAPHQGAVDGLCWTVDNLMANPTNPSLKAEEESDMAVLGRDGGKEAKESPLDCYIGIINAFANAWLQGKKEIEARRSFGDSTGVDEYLNHHLDDDAWVRTVGFVLLNLKNPDNLAELIPNVGNLDVGKTALTDKTYAALTAKSLEKISTLVSEHQSQAPRPE